MIQMRKVIVVNGEYKNREGFATPKNKKGNVMFYSKEGEFPYRTCLDAKDVKDFHWEEKE